MTITTFSSVFERRITFRHGDGTESPGFIDFDTLIAVGRVRVVNEGRAYLAAG